MIICTDSVIQTEQAGARLAGLVRPGDIIAMYGDLGSGKTAFVRGMAAGMKLDARVSSPTFTIVNEYEGQIPLFHFDMYRLADSDELFEIGWEDYINRGGVCAVEWSENVEEALNGAIRVSIRRIDDMCREITVEGGPQHADLGI